MVWTPGQRLNGDRYIIERKIDKGEGGFGATYLAQKAQNRQRVVIKTLKDDLLRDPNFAWFRDKFRDEALLLSLCRHPNIVQIDNYFTHDNLPCIAMEYVAGEDLWKCVVRCGILSETEALNYIRKVGEAVIVVHEKGLLHRDIKPQNIMVRDNQDAVLIDFGLARGFIPDRTQQMTFGLTHGFAPPEQYGEMGRFAEYTDVYALAATLYYMLTRTPPTAAFMRALNHPLKPPFQINPNISEAVHRAIMKGMEMDATKRPHSVEKWLAMLPQATGNWGQRGGVSPTIPSPQPPPQPVKLISAKGVDYRNLDRLLASGEWEEADEETTNKMLDVAGRRKERWLTPENIARFPCEDLRTIDQLWVKYSNGRFGFSVQKRIYESLGGSGKEDRKIWEAFGDRVGWRVQNNWLLYEDLKFDTKTPGRLPRGRIGWLNGRRGSLFCRIDICNMAVDYNETSSSAGCPSPPTNVLLPIPISADVTIKSERGVDYTKLRDLVATGKWQEADEETGKKMLEAAGRKEEGWLLVEDIDRFPCEDLRTIDQLWVKYSNGRFGFSVQKRIYESLGGTRKYDYKIWEAFGERVGWRVNNRWLYYNELKFYTHALGGHLPHGVRASSLLVGLFSRRDL